MQNDRVNTKHGCTSVALLLTPCLKGQGLNHKVIPRLGEGQIERSVKHKAPGFVRAWFREIARKLGRSSSRYPAILLTDSEIDVHESQESLLSVLPSARSGVLPGVKKLGF